MLENTNYIYLNHLRIWPDTQTHCKAMLLVYKENHFAKPASFTPSIHGEMFTPIGLNYSFWPYLHIGHLKNVLEGIMFYQYDAIFPCPLDFMGRDRQTYKDEYNNHENLKAILALGGISLKERGKNTNRNVLLVLLKNNLVLWNKTNVWYMTPSPLV